MSAFIIQIDMKRIEGNAAICNLYTGNRCVKIAMSVSDYESLVRDGFFIRDGKEADSAGVLNTTHDFVPKIQKQEETADEMEGCGALAE
jgi:hypothetical protein